MTAYSKRTTSAGRPAVALNDGVDFVEMPTWKIWLIQLLNIAGLGPIFGPILGALYDPSALLWIVIGSIFAGARTRLFFRHALHPLQRRKCT